MSTFARLFHAKRAHRRVSLLLTSLAISMLASPPARPQVGDLYNKAKQKLQKAQNTVNNTINPSSNDAAPGVSGASSSPAGGPKDPNTWDTFCTFRVARKTYYVTPVFTYNHPGTQGFFLNQVQPAWQAYVKQNYQNALAVSCNLNGAPAPSGLNKLRQQEIDAMANSYHMEIVNVGWTYNGVPPEASTSGAPSASQPTTVPRHDAPNASGTASTGQASGTAAPISGTTAVASPDAMFTSCFQTVEDGHKAYFTDIFATTDVVDVSSRQITEQRTALANDNMRAFRKFLTSTYGEVFKFFGSGSSGCEDPAPRTRAALKRSANLERFRTNSYFKSGIVETHWANGPRPAATASTPAAVTAPSAVSADTPAAAPEATFTHCSIHVPASRKVYISDVFALDPGAADPGPRKAKLLAQFVQFIAANDGENPDARRGRYQELCAPAEPLAQAQLSREAEQDRIRHNGMYRDGIVEAHWAGGARPAAANEQAAEAGVAAGPVAPARGNMTMLDALLAKERRMAPGYCEGNDSLKNTYDCQCFAQKIEDSRKQNASLAYASGGDAVLHPQLGQLAATIDLRACVDVNKTTAYMQRMIDNAFQAKSAEWRSAVGTCAADKFVAQMQSDPEAMKRWSVDQTNDITTCRTR